MAADDDEEDSLFHSLIVFVCNVPFSVLTSFVRGWAVARLWGWFVVPIFGLPTLSNAAAFGLALVMGLMTNQISLAREDQKYQGTYRRPLIIGLSNLVVSLYSVLLGKIVVSWWL